VGVVGVVVGDEGVVGVVVVGVVVDGLRRGGRARGAEPEKRGTRDSGPPPHPPHTDTKKHPL